MTIGIIDYGMGNLRSVLNALEIVGGEGRVLQSPAELAMVDGIVLPGVGAFPDAMKNLVSRGWVEPLEQEVHRNGKPFLGICLGMQLLATRGIEHGDHPGLGWIDGEVLRLQPKDPTLRVPHIGWNDVMVQRDSALLAGLPKVTTCYFLHSYALYPRDQAVVTGLCDYGESFVAAIEQDNIMGAQFHPEKSQKTGLAVLKNFLSRIKQC